MLYERYMYGICIDVYLKKKWPSPYKGAHKHAQWQDKRTEAL